MIIQSLHLALGLIAVAVLIARHQYQELVLAICYLLVSALSTFLWIAFFQSYPGPSMRVGAHLLSTGDFCFFGVIVLLLLEAPDVKRRPMPLEAEIPKAELEKPAQEPTSTHSECRSHPPGQMVDIPLDDHRPAIPTKVSSDAAAVEMEFASSWQAMRMSNSRGFSSSILGRSTPRPAPLNPGPKEIPMSPSPKVVGQTVVVEKQKDVVVDLDESEEEWDQTTVGSNSSEVMEEAEQPARKEKKNDDIHLLKEGA